MLTLVDAVADEDAATSLAAAAPATRGGPDSSENQASRVARANGSDRLRHDLRNIAADGTCYHVMVGLGETYLSAYILHLGVGEVASGLLTASPMLLGAVLQLASPWGIRRLGSHRAWVVLCAIVQATSLLLLLAAGLLPALRETIVLVAATLYWAGALGAGPAWNTWIETVVPRAIRARFFSRRARLTQAGTCVGFLTAGLALHWGAGHHAADWVFVALFVAAAIARYASAWFLATQSEPRPEIARGERLQFGRVTARLRHDSAARLIAYLMTVQVAVYFSGPYFAPFMFRELGLSFYDYTCLVGVTFVAKVLCAPLWGRVAGWIGSRGLLWIGGIGIVPVSGLWLFSHDYWYLVAIQAFGGITWSAYELAMLLVFFDAVPHHRRTSLMTFYNLGNAAAQVGGALLGGWALAALGENIAAYHFLFGVSSVGRVAALFMLYLAARSARVAVETPAAATTQGKPHPRPFTPQRQAA